MSRTFRIFFKHQTCLTSPMLSLYSKHLRNQENSQDMSLAFSSPFLLLPAPLLLRFVRAKLQTLLKRNLTIKPLKTVTRTMPVVLLKHKNICFPASGYRITKCLWGFLSFRFGLVILLILHSLIFARPESKWSLSLLYLYSIEGIIDIRQKWRRRSKVSPATTSHVPPMTGLLTGRHQVLRDEKSIHNWNFPCRLPAELFPKPPKVRLTSIWSRSYIRDDLTWG